ncbi:ricin-type beta-trefoil lectin domain protein [Dactylosporangium sp. NPDC049742]|uniref:ricin-type beta-trefoil lectin domain protein n=1 Tax=Dactylosporangium sp. NPDC049742 TaxID=3154737 RepID=UPI0034474BE9
MSVAEDGNEQEQPGGAAQRADRAARHRVPPTASATAKVPLLPEPFNPAKPTFPAGAAIPRQRRGGPTAIATASIPVTPVEDDRPDFDALFADALGDEPEPSSEAPSPDAAAPDTVDPDTVDLDADSPDAAGPDTDDPEQGDDPATVGTLAGEVRASAAESLPPVDEEPPVPPVPAVPVALVKPAVEAPALVDPAAFDPAEPDPAADEPEDAAVPAAPPVGVAPVLLAADDSPTVADYVPPAIAIVTDDPADTDDGPDYRGARRRNAAWRRYPVGAVAVAVLILLVTAAVVLQLVSSGDHGTPVSADASPQRYPGIGGLPELTRDAGASPSASPSAARSSASPTPSRSKSLAPAGPPPSASASPSKPASSAPPPPPQVTTGQLVGVGSRLCLEYRSGQNNQAVIDACDRAGSRNTNQRWTIRSDGSIRADGGCLDVANAGKGNGNAVQLYSCNGTVAQQWTFRGDTLVNPNSGRCLDVANGGTGAGTQVIIWDCTGAANQRWTRQPF